MWGKIYRYSLIEKIKFPEELKRMEDVLFALEVFEHADRCVFSTKGAYIYRLHGDSVCNRVDLNFGKQVSQIIARLNEFVDASGKRKDFQGAMDETQIYLFHEWLLLTVVPDKNSGCLVKIKKVRKQLKCTTVSVMGQQHFTEKKWKIFNFLFVHQCATLIYLFACLIKAKRNR